jgi:hypothetical protein
LNGCVVRLRGGRCQWRVGYGVHEKRYRDIINNYL